MNYKVLAPELKPQDAILTRSPDKNFKINELYTDTANNPDNAREMMPDDSDISNESGVTKVRTIEELGNIPLKNTFRAQSSIVES